jgi:hypothetical protein
MWRFEPSEATQERVADSCRKDGCDAALHCAAMLTPCSGRPLRIRMSDRQCRAGAQRATRAPSWTCQSARLTLRGKNTATKIENNSKIFDALSVVKEIDLKID